MRGCIPLAVVSSLVAVARLVRADPAPTGGLAIGVGGMHHGATAGYATATAGAAIDPQDAVVLHAVGALANASTRAGYLGVGYDRLGDIGFVGGGVGVLAGTSGSAHVAFAARAGVALAITPDNALTFALEVVVPAAESPVPLVAFAVGYRR